MKKHLLDYVKKYSAIPHKLCDDLVNELKSAKWEQHTFYDSKSGKTHTRSGNNELWITGYQPVISTDLTSCINIAINKYLVDVDSPTWPGPNNLTITRFNRYDPGQTMAVHSDHIHSIFDGERKGIPIITILCSLNNEYTGGEFIMFEDTLVKLNKGDILIFPSIFLYPHKVLPVKSGTRYTCVNWAW